MRGLSRRSLISACVLVVGIVIAAFGATVLLDDGEVAAPIQPPDPPVQLVCPVATSGTPQPGFSSIVTDGVAYRNAQELVDSSQLIVAGVPVPEVRVLRLTPEKFDEDSVQFGVVYAQEVTVRQVIKGTPADSSIDLALSGLNLESPEILGAVEQGSIEIPAYGLGPLSEGTYVLFLQPGGVVGVPPNLTDYSAYWTPLGEYQGTVPLVDGAIRQRRKPDLACSNVAVSPGASFGDRLLVNDLDGLSVTQLRAMSARGSG
jgi:hypothetical protein